MEGWATGGWLFFPKKEHFLLDSRFLCISQKCSKPCIRPEVFWAPVPRPGRRRGPGQLGAKSQQTACSRRTQRLSQWHSHRDAVTVPGPCPSQYRDLSVRRDSACPCRGRRPGAAGITVTIVSLIQVERQSVAGLGHRGGPRHSVLSDSDHHSLPD